MRSQAISSPTGGSTSITTFRRPRLLRWVTFGCWAYFLLLIALWFGIWLTADRWWVTTVLVFGPKWIFGLPLAALLPAALLAPRKLLLPSVGSGWVLLVPVMGFCTPFKRATQLGATVAPVRVLTCNVDYSALNTAELASIIAEQQPDIVALQEWTSKHESALFGNGVWHVRRVDELFLASRYPIRAVEDLAQNRWGGSGSAARFDLLLPGGVIHFVDLHLASPHGPFDSTLDRSRTAPGEVEENSRTRREQSQVIVGALQHLGGNVLIAGDFNTPCQSAATWRCWGDYSDAFSVGGLGFGFTYHARVTATRIDHILAGAGFQCRRCWVERNVGSAHRPVLADFDAVAGRP